VARNPQIVVEYVAKTADLKAGMDDAGKATGGFKSKLAGLGKAGALAGLAAIGATLKVGISEWQESTKVAAQTQAVLKSTGNAANVTAGHVSDLAESLMKKSGVDDEAIASGENLLLTFTNIRNEAGKGNDVFDQTTKAALDMSVALGTDMKSAAMQLGKALNDPIKGVTKLQRSGVTFTEAQKEQIKTLQESGKTLEAQKIILGEVNKEFGGSAEAAGKTLPGQLNILKESFNNLAGSLVGQMIPPLMAFAKLLTEHKTSVLAVVGVLAALVAVTVAVSAATAAWNAIQAIAAVASEAWAAAQWLVNAALAANPIGLVVVAIAALVAALIVAYKTSDTFRHVVDAAFDAVVNSAKAALNWIKGNWPLLLSILTGPIGAAVIAIARHWGDITGAARDAVHSIQTAFNALVAWLTGSFKSAVSTAATAVGNVFDFIAGGARDAYDSVKRNLNGIVSFIVGIVGSVTHAATEVANAIKKPINAVLSTWNSLEFPRVSFHIPGFKIGKKKFGDKDVGFGPFGFPDVKLLAKGGIVTSPTLAMVGEAGPEAVVPLSSSGSAIEVRVFIGDTELRGLVRTEIVDNNTGIARTLLAGGAA
jgi:Prophage tail length tape measure protein